MARNLDGVLAGVGMWRTEDADEYLIDDVSPSIHDVAKRQRVRLALRKRLPLCLGAEHYVSHCYGIGPRNAYYTDGAALCCGDGAYCVVL